MSAPKKKKRATATPLAKKTMELYRGLGYHVAKVETQKPFPAEKLLDPRSGKLRQSFFLTVRKDLFDGLDLLAFHFDSPGVVGIQVCRAADFAAHLKKLLASPVLKVQSVADEQGYLKNLGRALVANMIRDAENAENQAKQSIAEAEAEARRRSESAQKQAEATVLTRRNELRAGLAKLEAEAKAIENEAEIAQETARAEAEQELQRLRAELERKRLEVDVGIPAEASRLAAEAQARADAAPVLETGKATAQALSMVAAEWERAGAVGRELYVLQHLEEIVARAADRVAETRVGELSVVDAGDGRSYTQAVAMYPAAVSRVMGELGELLGVDLRRLASGAPPGVSNGSGRAAELPAGGKA